MVQGDRCFLRDKCVNGFPWNIVCKKNINVQFVICFLFFLLKS